MTRRSARTRLDLRSADLHGDVTADIGVRPGRSPLGPFALGPLPFGLGVETRSVDLPQARTADRLGVERGEALVNGPEFVLEHSFRVRPGSRRHVVLKRREGVDVRWREHVGAGRQ